MSQPPNQFRLAINMSGAISAGAYTAGVLDFLIEALEEWEKAKVAFRAQIATHATSVQNAVPLHDVSINAFTGASAGGMCAAIAATMVQGDFGHIRTGEERGTNNTFYESWVNTIDISEFLQTADINGGKALVSLLDCTIIDTIADQAIKPPTPISKSYIASDLSLFLMLTNVRGVSYPLYVDGSMSLEEYIAFYGDKLHFQVVPNGGSINMQTAKGLPLDGTGEDKWVLLKDAAKATGAFPIFLAPRKLTRQISDYAIPPWVRIGDPRDRDAIPPDFPTPLPAEWDTLNVDGGLTDNDPMALAEDFLAINNGSAVTNAAGRKCNPSTPDTANCSVLTVAPFPATDRYNPDYFSVSDKNPDPTNLFTMLGNLIPVLLSQSRFLGESLGDLTESTSFDRFVIAPSDPARSADKALQSSTLGAFGGFLDRRFRKHDFLLGRRNCQKFLSTNFVLPISNPVIQAGMALAGPWATSVQSLFKRPSPNPKIAMPSQDWIPIIPLCGTAFIEVPPPIRETMSEDDLESVVDQVMHRIDGIKGPLLEGAPEIIKVLVNVATWGPFSGPLKDAISNKLRSSLEDNIDPLN